jgi:hypothetical protein
LNSPPIGVNLCSVRIFVLTTGRSGSLTFAMACSHITNFSSAHESRAALIGDSRFAYPDDHIEIDNRLTWFPGPLATRFPDARYVHLVRDHAATADSYLQRWPRPPATAIGRMRLARTARPPGALLMPAFANGIVMRWAAWPEHERRGVSEFMIETINANIREFLKGRDHLTVELEAAADGFGRFWDWIGATGDKEAAVHEWSVRHHARRATSP